MNLVVSDLLTHYTRAGKGKLVVIVPGWADTSATWRDMQKLLTDTYDVVVLDLPGFGGSQMPAAAWGLGEYADFIASFVDKLGSGPVYALVGHSNGGAIAIHALAGAKLHPKKLILLASAGVRGQANGRNQMLKLLAKTGKVVTAPLPRSVKQRLRQKLYQSAGSDMLVAEHMQETFKRIVAADVQADAAKVTIPTLLVYGSNDADTPVKYGEMLQKQLKQSELKIVPGAGHFVFRDQPDMVLGYIREFLQS